MANKPSCTTKCVDKWVGIFGVVLLLFCMADNLNAQSYPFLPSGDIQASGTYVIPQGVTAITIEAVGGGGGGAYNTGVGGCGGGGGGAYASSMVFVTPGDLIIIHLGKGGLGTNVTSIQKNGEASYVTYVTNDGVSGTVRAAGGMGAPNGIIDQSNPGGAGGNSADCNGNITYSGGAGGSGLGGNGENNAGGGGGGAAGRTGGGAAGENGTGSGVGNIGGNGVAPGGNGGNGATRTDNTADNGYAYGGGGGGSSLKKNQGTEPGGNGADGGVIITYTCDQYLLSSTTSSVTEVCEETANATATITFNATYLNSAGATGILPDGNYTVMYNMGIGVDRSAVVTVVGGTASFNANLPSPFINDAIITITKIKSSTGLLCESVIKANNQVTIFEKPLSTAHIPSDVSYVELCAGENIDIPVAISGGNAPYTLYYTENMNGVTTSKSITTNEKTPNLSYTNCTENFTVTLDSIKNSGNCSNPVKTDDMFTVVVHRTPGITTTSDKTCNGVENYSFSLDPPFGEGNDYSFTWKITNVVNVGNVTVGTSGSANTINLPGPLVTDGLSDGTITIDVISTFTSPTPNYTKTCTNTQTVTITVGTNLTVQLIDKKFCSNDITLGVTDIDLTKLIVQSSGYTYSFYEDNEGKTKINTPTTFPLKSYPTTVYVQAVAASCTSDFIPVPINVETSPEVSIQNCNALQNILQGNESTMFISVNGGPDIDGVPQDAILSQWTSSAPDVVKITNVGAGDFVAQCQSGTAMLTYNYTDKNGCPAPAQTCTITVVAPSVPTISMNPSTGYICSNSSVELTATDYIAAYATAESVAYKWEKDGNVLPFDDNAIYIEVNQAGSYTVTATVNGCPVAESEQAVVADVTPTATIISNVDDVCAGDPVLLTLTLTGVAPWTVTYEMNNELEEITINASDVTGTGPYQYTFMVNPSETPNTTYEIVSVADFNCHD